MKVSNYSEPWYEISNRVDFGLPSQVYIYGDIGDMGLNSADFINDLRGQSGDLEIHINTRGGLVSDGIAIHNAIKRHPGAKTVIVDSMCASIGTVIAMAGDTVLMSDGSQMMIHEGHGMIGGDAEDFRKMADVLDKNSDIIAGFYADKTGKPRAYWRDLMKQETWYDAPEAIAAGLADGMANSVRNAMDDNNGWVQDDDGTWRFDPDGDGDDDSTPEGDTDHDYFDKNGHQIRSIPPKPSNSAGTPVTNVVKPHGDVPYADPGYLDAEGEQVSKSGKPGVARYPIDEAHVMAAWSYINQDKNSSQYTSTQLDEIKSKIKAAMKAHGHDVSEDASNAVYVQIQSTLREVFK